MMKLWPFVMDDRQPEQQPDRARRHEIKLFVREDLYRAFQRCVWMQVHEAGRDRFAIMEEAVIDFLTKHGC